MLWLRRHHRSATLLAALLALPGLASAQNRDRSVEVGVTPTFVRFDTQLELTSRVGPSIFVGYNFTKRHGVELEYMSTTATPKTGPSFPVDMDVVRLGYLFNAYPREKVVSFFRIGVGSWNLDPEETPGAIQPLRQADTNFMIYSGGGVRFFLNPTFALRFAGTVDIIQGVRGFSSPDLQATGDVGVVFLLGGQEPREKPTETAEPEEKNPQ